MDKKQKKSPVLYSSYRRTKPGIGQTSFFGYGSYGAIQEDTIEQKFDKVEKEMTQAEVALENKQISKKKYNKIKRKYDKVAREYDTFLKEEAASWNDSFGLLS